MLLHSNTTLRNLCNKKFGQKMLVVLWFSYGFSRDSLRNFGPKAKFESFLNNCLSVLWSARQVSIITKKRNKSQACHREGNQNTQTYDIENQRHTSFAQNMDKQTFLGNTTGNLGFPMFSPHAEEQAHLRNTFGNLGFPWFRIHCKRSKFKKCLWKPRVSMVLRNCRRNKSKRYLWKPRVVHGSSNIAEETNPRNACGNLGCSMVSHALKSKQIYKILVEI